MSHLDRMIELARRKERLIARTARERAAIGAAIRVWEKPLGLADRALSAARYLRAHPLVLAALLAVAVALRRRNLLAWAGRGFTLWRAWRAFSTWSARHLA